MGIEPPYIYDPPSRSSVYNDFDPKAYTKAATAANQSMEQLDKPQSRQTGYNRHPDSYLVLPYGQTNVKPMSPSTNRNVKVARWIQLAFRTVAMISVLGLLVFAILINHTQSTVSWVLRAAPAVDILVTAYAIYHLLRSAKSRPPGSSASYHIFAFVIDIAIIPFYVFIVLAGKSNIALAEGTPGRWSTLLKSPVASQDIMQATWLVAAVIGGTHAVALFISCYLAYMFYKIAQMPADMNPLEENLTSRRKSKHKYKNSEQVHYKHDSAISFRDAAYTLDEKSIRNNNVPFFDTREVSPVRYSPHNPSTAAISRENLAASSGGMYSLAPSQQYSRLDLPSQEERPVSPISQDLSEVDITDTSPHLPSLTASSIYSNQSNPPLPRKSSKRVSSAFSSTDNWYAMDDDVENRDPAISIIEEEPSDTSSVTLHSPPSRSCLAAVRNPSYQAIRQSSAFSFEMGNADAETFSKRTLSPPPQNPLNPPESGFTYQPLRMNPPTPPPPVSRVSSPSPKPEDIPAALRPRSRTQTSLFEQKEDNSRALKERSGNEIPDLALPKVEVNDKPGANESPAKKSNPGTPTKRRQYGSLRSAMQGVRGSASPQGNLKAKESPKPAVMSFKKEPGVGLGEWMSNSSVVNENAEKPVIYTTEREVDHKGRVVSRSGADGMANVGGWKKRNVSGKAAEEGRGGGWARRSFSGKRLGF